VRPRCPDRRARRFSSSSSPFRHAVPVGSSKWINLIDILVSECRPPVNRRKPPTGAVATPAPVHMSIAIDMRRRSVYVRLQRQRLHPHVARLSLHHLPRRGLATRPRGAPLRLLSANKPHCPSARSPQLPGHVWLGLHVCARASGGVLPAERVNGQKA
jgi:hypothetical protein